MPQDKPLLKIFSTIGQLLAKIGAETIFILVCGREIHSLPTGFFREVELSRHLIAPLNREKSILVL